MPDYGTHSLSEKMVQVKLGKVLEKILHKQITEKSAWGFRKWYRSFQTPQEQEIIYKYSMTILLDTERRLKLLKESLKRDVFRRGE